MSAPINNGQIDQGCSCSMDKKGNQTPVKILNRPGLDSIMYRAGTHSTFKKGMIAGLSDAHKQALARLTTRNDDDLTIALIDCWAMVADVLTFYQERIANESYLRTATERRSILELARGIGYELKPGLAAGTYLAFTLEDAPGAPGYANILKGTKVQSIPGPDEKPQVYETIEPLDIARTEWNAIKPRSTKFYIPDRGEQKILLEGVGTNLKPGDGLLMVGKERIQDKGSERWDFRLVESVTPDFQHNRTEVKWHKGLGWKKENREVSPASEDFRVYALRLRASVFGYNAPDWRALPENARATYLGLSDPSKLCEEENEEWPDFEIFAPTYPEVRIPRSKILIIHPTVKSVAEAAKKAANQVVDEVPQKAMQAAMGAVQSGIETVVGFVETFTTSIEQLKTAAKNAKDESEANYPTNLTDNSNSALAKTLQSLKELIAMIHIHGPDVGTLMNKTNDLKNSLNSLFDILDLPDGTWPEIRHPDSWEELKNLLHTNSNGQWPDITKPTSADVLGVVDTIKILIETATSFEISLESNFDRKLRDLGNNLAVLISTHPAFLPFNTLRHFIENDPPNPNADTGLQTVFNNLQENTKKAIATFEKVRGVLGSTVAIGEARIIANLLEKTLDAAVHPPAGFSPAPTPEFVGFVARFTVKVSKSLVLIKTLPKLLADTLVAEGVNAVAAGKKGTEEFNTFIEKVIGSPPSVPLKSDSQKTFLNDIYNSFNSYITNTNTDPRILKGIGKHLDLGNKEDIAALVVALGIVVLIDAVLITGVLGATTAISFAALAVYLTPLLILALAGFGTFLAGILSMPIPMIISNPALIVIPAGLLSAGGGAVSVSLFAIVLGGPLVAALPFLLGSSVIPAGKFLDMLAAFLVGPELLEMAKEIEARVVSAVTEALKDKQEITPRRPQLERDYDTIDLDSRYQHIAPGGWAVLSTPGYVECYKITQVTEASRTEYMLTSKTTRISLEGEHLSWRSLPDTDATWTGLKQEEVPDAVINKLKNFTKNGFDSCKDLENLLNGILLSLYKEQKSRYIESIMGIDIVSRITWLLPDTDATWDGLKLAGVPDEVINKLKDFAKHGFNSRDNLESNLNNLLNGVLPSLCEETKRHIMRVIKSSKWFLPGTNATWDGLTLADAPDEVINKLKDFAKHGFNSREDLKSNLENLLNDISPPLDDIKKSSYKDFIMGVIESRTTWFLPDTYATWADLKQEGVPDEVINKLKVFAKQDFNSRDNLESNLNNLLNDVLLSLYNNYKEDIMGHDIVSRTTWFLPDTDVTWYRLKLAGVPDEVIKEVKYFAKYDFKDAGDLESNLENLLNGILPLLYDKQKSHYIESIMRLVIPTFDVRSTTVFAQSEELKVAESPFFDPIMGVTIKLAYPVPLLPPGRHLLIQGRPSRVKLSDEYEGNLKLVNDQEIEHPIEKGDTLTILEIPQKQPSDPDKVCWRLRNNKGIEGLVEAKKGDFEFDFSDPKEPLVAEHAVLSSQDIDQDGRTILTLTKPLRHAYDPGTVTIFANVAPATHGETVVQPVIEVLGSGDASQQNQRFVLKQTPLTYYIPSPDASCSETTLEIWVDDILWEEAPTFYGRGPRERIYMTRQADDGSVTVIFGDGKNGACLTTGRENIRAVYRKGIGREGLVKAGQLSLLMTRPLGVKEVRNPLASEGAQDRQTMDHARYHAPLTMLTFDRLVSLKDYEDFSRTFAGIAKAHAVWTRNPPTRGVFITVAGPQGDAVSEDGLTMEGLLTAIQKHGNPLIPVWVKSYKEKRFRIKGTVTISDDRKPEHVEHVRRVIEDALTAHFSFDAREFGQWVTMGEIIGVIQNVPGVVCVDIDALYYSDEPDTNTVTATDADANKNTPKAFLQPYTPQDGQDVAGISPAELLLFDDKEFQIVVIPLYR